MLVWTRAYRVVLVVVVVEERGIGGGSSWVMFGEGSLLVDELLVPAEELLVFVVESLSLGKGF